MLKEVAKEHGLFVTFMPKPTTGDWRSGAHINHSMQATDRPGVNIFGGENGAWERYRLQCGGRPFFGMAPALTAIAAPHCQFLQGALVERVGAFEGGTVTWAPTYITYGFNNRSAMLRLPQARFAIENPRHRHDDEHLSESRDDGRRFSRRNT